MSTGPSPQATKVEGVAMVETKRSNTGLIILGVGTGVACLVILAVVFKGSRGAKSSNLNKMLNNLNRRVGI
jgi:hypothetical protein